MWSQMISGKWDRFWQVSRLTDSRVVTAFSTSQAALATNVTRNANMDDHIFEIAVSFGFKSAQYQELLPVIQVLENGFQSPLEFA